MDPAIAEAVARRIFFDTGVRDTPPPYGEPQLAGIEHLTVKHARDLSGLAAFPNLKILTLKGCDPVRLDVLAGVATLRMLNIDCSAIEDLSVVPRIPSLRDLKVRNGFVRDLSPLLEFELPPHLDATGNPLTEESYRDVVAALREKGVSVKVSDERAWRLTLRLHEASLPFSYYRNHGSHLLCRPGLARTDRPEAAHPKIGPDELEALLDKDPALIEPLFERDELMPTLSDVMPKGALLALPPEVAVWNEFEQIRKDLFLEKLCDSALGTLHYSLESTVNGQHVVARHFDGELPPQTAVGYADIVRVLGNWLGVTPEVAQLVEFLPTVSDGADFVAMPYREYRESLASYERPDCPQPPPELERMRAAVRAALVPFTDAPVDRSLAAVIQRTLLEPSGKTYFDAETRRFVVVDPKVTREAVVTWWETLHRKS